MHYWQTNKARWIALGTVVFMCAEKHMEKVKEENMNAVIGKRGQLGMPILQMELEVRSFKFKHHVALINMPFHIAFLRREPVSVLFSVFPRERPLLLCLYYYLWYIILCWYYYMIVPLIVKALYKRNKVLSIIITIHYLLFYILKYMHSTTVFYNLCCIYYLLFY